MSYAIRPKQHKMDPWEWSVGLLLMIGMLIGLVSVFQGCSNATAATRDYRATAAAILAVENVSKPLVAPVVPAERSYARIGDTLSPPHDYNARKSEQEFPVAALDCPDGQCSAARPRALAAPRVQYASKQPRTIRWQRPRLFSR